MATGALVGQVNNSDIVLSSLVLGTAAAFAIAVGASQFAAVDLVAYVSLPANHGGLKLNWLVPSRLDTGAWPLAKIRDDWSVIDVGFAELPRPIPCASINDSLHSDAAVIVAPGAAARELRVRGSCLFRASAGGGTINLQGALAGAGASITILAFSQVEARLY